MSLPFIPASREVTSSWGRAQRGHGKEVGGGGGTLYITVCHIAGCVVFLPPLLLNTNRNRNHSREGEGRGLPLSTWQHPDRLGSNSPSYRI